MVNGLRLCLTYGLAKKVLRKSMKHKDGSAYNMTNRRMIPRLTGLLAYRYNLLFWLSAVLACGGYQLPGAYLPIVCCPGHVAFCLWLVAFGLQLAAFSSCFILRNALKMDNEKLALCEPVRKQYQCSKEQNNYCYNGAFLP